MLAEAKENPWCQAQSDSSVHIVLYLTNNVEIHPCKIYRGGELEYANLPIRYDLFTKSALPFST